MTPPLQNKKSNCRFNCEDCAKWDGQCDWTCRNMDENYNEAINESIHLIDE